MTEEEKSAGKTVIFGAGSCYLRIGTGEHTSPVLTPHCIAVHHPQNSRVSFSMSSSLPSETGAAERLNRIRAVRKDIQISLRGLARRRADQPMVIQGGWQQMKGDEGQDMEVENEINEQEEITKFGTDALGVREEDGWDVRFPVQRGRFHVPSSTYGVSSGAVVDDIERIWSHALFELLGSRQPLDDYEAIVVIPDAFSRREVRALADIMLCRIGFGRVFFHQESPCALFGARMTSGIVVDVGDQTLIPPRYVIPISRVRIPVGIYDVAECLLFILRDGCKIVDGPAFTFSSCDLQKKQRDRDVLYGLVETYCHLSDGYEIVKSVQLEVNKRRKYRADVGDPLLLAPLALFRPEILALTPDEGGASPGYDVGVLVDVPINEGEDAYWDGEDDDDTVVYDNDEYNGIYGGSLEALHAAVVRSVLLAGENYFLKKNARHILLVGGGVQIPGLSELLDREVNVLLEQEQAERIAVDEVQVVEVQTKKTNKRKKKKKGEEKSEEIPVEVEKKTVSLCGELSVLPLPPDILSQHVSWQGACLMRNVSAIQEEMWITRQEWEKVGSRLLRERLPFQF